MEKCPDHCPASRCFGRRCLEVAPSLKLFHIVNNAVLFHIVCYSSMLILQSCPVHDNLFGFISTLHLSSCLHFAPTCESSALQCSALRDVGYTSLPCVLLTLGVTHETNGPRLRTVQCSNSRLTRSPDRLYMLSPLTSLTWFTDLT